MLTTDGLYCFLFVASLLTRVRGFINENITQQNRKTIRNTRKCENLVCEDQQTLSMGFVRNFKRITVCTQTHMWTNESYLNSQLQLICIFSFLTILVNIIVR